MNTSIWNIRKRINAFASKSPNGFSNALALACFALTLQVMSTCCLYATQSAQLLLCQDQSTLDLSVLSHVSHMIEENERVRRCHFPSDQLITQIQIEVADTNVQLTDCDSYVLCTYEKGDRYIEMKVYYEESSICGLDIDAIQKTG